MTAKQKKAIELVLKLNIKSEDALVLIEGIMESETKWYYNPNITWTNPCTTYKNPSDSAGVNWENLKYTTSIFHPYNPDATALKQATTAKETLDSIDLGHYRADPNMNIAAYPEEPIPGTLDGVKAKPNEVIR